MKKTYSLLLILLTIFLGTACDENNNSNTGNPPPSVFSVGELEDHFSGNWGLRLNPSTDCQGNDMSDINSVLLFKISVSKNAACSIQEIDGQGKVIQSTNNNISYTCLFESDYIKIIGNQKTSNHIDDCPVSSTAEIILRVNRNTSNLLGTFESRDIFKDQCLAQNEELKRTHNCTISGHVEGTRFASTSVNRTQDQGGSERNNGNRENTGGTIDNNGPADEGGSERNSGNPEPPLYRAYIIEPEVRGIISAGNREPEAEPNPNRPSPTYNGVVNKNIVIAPYGVLLGSATMRRLKR